MSLLTQKDNLIKKKKVRNFLNRNVSSTEIELRVEEFLNAHVLFYLKNTIEEGCISTKYREGTILQEKDLRFNFFKSKSSESLGHNFWKKYKLSTKKTSKKIKKKPIQNTNL